MSKYQILRILAISSSLSLNFIGCQYSVKKLPTQSDIKSTTFYNKEELIAQDILFRVEKDFYHYQSDKDNIKKLVKDCVFEESDLNNNGIKEYIVQYNWFSDGRFNMAKDHNMVRGAQGQGRYFIYELKNGNPIILGIIEGQKWKLLSSKTSNYTDIETYEHNSFNEGLTNIYKYSIDEYKLVSSILYEFQEDGSRKKLKTYFDTKK